MNASQIIKYSFFCSDEELKASCHCQLHAGLATAFISADNALMIIGGITEVFFIAACIYKL